MSKTEFKKTSKFRLAVSSQKRREWEDTTRQKWLVFQKSKNQTKPSQMIKNHDQRLKQYDIRCSGGVGDIRSSKIAQKKDLKNVEKYMIYDI